MTTAIARGDLLTLTAPAGGVSSGKAYMIGSLLVIAAADAAVDEEFEGATVGVFDVPKPDQEAWTEGAKIYFDDSLSPEPLFTTESSGTVLVGAAAKAVPLSLVLETDDTDSPPALTLGAADIQVDAYADLAGDTITVTVNGVETVLTEGVDFVAETSDEDTAANLGVAIALIPGITVVVTTDTVAITVTGPSITGHVRLDGAAR